MQSLYTTIRSVELGVCPMQLFHLEQYLHYLQCHTEAVSFGKHLTYWRIRTTVYSSCTKCFMAL